MEIKEDNRIVATKESLKGSRKESSEERNASPALLVLRRILACRSEKKIALKKVESKSCCIEEKACCRKEDGAVRPEKNRALLCQNETKRDPIAKRTNCRPASSISVRKRHILDCTLQTSRIIYCPTDRTRPGGQHSQNFSHQHDGLTPVGKCSRSIDHVKCQE